MFEMIGRKYLKGPCSLLIITLLFYADQVNSQENCKWSNDWKRQVTQASCPRNSPHLAFIEENDSRYRAKCCPDRESLEFEQEDLEQCETTECLVDNTRSNPCSTLPQYITANGQRLEYEVALKDGCKEGGGGRRGRNGTAAVCCPKDSLAGLLVSTSAAEKNEFPHMASTTGSTKCGATVYNQDFVITAAHCFINSTTGHVIKGPHSVILGTNLDELQTKSNTYPVAEVIVHEHYSFLKNHSERRREYKRYYNDIALLRLGKSINFRKHTGIRALEIAPRNFRPEAHSTQALILGWGATQLGRGSDHLQKANVLMREDSLCFDKRQGLLGEKQYEVMEFADQFLCLGGIMHGSVSNSAGRGDSGGPAICRGANGEAVLCGVCSFGSEHDEEKCAEHRNQHYCQPSVYEDVGYFHDWIVKHAGKQDPNTLHRAQLYGNVAPRGKHAHQVHFTSKDGMSCGGTLVSVDTVITAAHCVLDDEGERRRGIRIVAGIENLVDGNAADQRHVYIPTRNGITRPQKFKRYAGLDKLNDSKSGRRMFREAPYNEDIAVIKLDRRVEGMRRNQLPRLPSAVNYKPGHATEVALPLPEGRRSYGRLLERKFNILTRRECRKRLDRLHAVGVHVRMDPTKIMCGVEVYSGGSTCDRELGGGLLCVNGRGEDVLCGIQMFRMCEMTLPSAFLNVGKYLELIRGVMDVDD